MEKLEIREYVVTEVARSHPTPSMVYICPKCRVGHKLQHFSGSTEKVICQGCKEVYEKPQEAIPILIPLPSREDEQAIA